MVKKKEKLKDIIPFIYHDSKMFKIINPDIIKNLKPSTEQLEKSVGYDILNSFHNRLLSIFKNKYIIKYFVRVIKNDENYKIKFKNINFKNLNSFFLELENIIQFLEYRYIIFLENNFKDSYKEIVNQPNIKKSLDEPTYIFNVDLNSYNDIFSDIENIIDKQGNNFNNELIIKKELLLFGIGYNIDDIKRYGTKYILSFDEIKLQERYFVDKNTLYKKETKNIDPGKIKYSSFNENEIKEMFEVENVNIKNLEVNFKFTNYEVVINEKNIYTVIPFISFNKNEDFFHSAFFRKNNISYGEITSNYFKETPQEMKKFNFVKHLLKQVGEKYVFNDELNIKNSFDVEDFVEKLKIEQSKSIYKLNNDEQEKMMKDLAKLDYLVTVYKKFDLKYSFLLSGKPYGDGLYPTIGTTNSLLTRYLINLQDKISGLGKNFKNSIFFNIKKGNLDFLKFNKNSKKNFNDDKKEKLQNIIEDILLCTQTKFYQCGKSETSEIIKLQDFLTIKN